MKILQRGDSSSVAMIRELREATEGSKLNVAGEIATKMQTTEDRVKMFDEIVGQ